MQIDPQGPFSLRAAAGFGFGPNEGRVGGDRFWDGAMRLAFPVDGGRGYAGVVLRQAQPDGPVDVDLTTTSGVNTAAALVQVARTVSLDHDGREFAAVGDRDPVLGALQRAHPGQRPVLFYSPYEAAAWSVLSARRPAAQGAKVRAELGARHGATFELDGEVCHAFPQPGALAEIEDGFPGLNDAKVQRLRALATAARAGDLDVTRLHSLGPDAAYEDVQRLPGIGPFFAGLIVLRASGFADALVPMPQHRGHDHLARYYGLHATPTSVELAELAERWRPFRTWAMVLIRLAGERGTRI